MKLALGFSLLFSSLLCVLISLPHGGDQENSLILFFGRFHPMVLHLPIGATLALLFMEILRLIKPKLDIDKACELLLWFCSISIVPTVFAGHLLSMGGGYNEELLDLHQNLGWASAFLLIWLVVLRNLSQIRAEFLWAYRSLLLLSVIVMSLAGHHGGSLTHGSDYLTKHMPLELQKLLGLLEEKDRNEDELVSEEETYFRENIQPVMAQYCIGCHGPDKQKGNLRLDELHWDFIHGPDAEGWHTALDQINAGEMPPEGKSQPTDQERRLLVDWITGGLEAATEAKKKQPQQTMRRLTRAQYSNALNSLLGLDVDFADRLPEDGKSKMGFSNDSETLQSSPLHLETFQKIARDALNRVIAPKEKPDIIHYRLDIGKGRGKGKTAGSFGGYQSVRIHPDDFEVQILDKRGESLDKKALDELRKKIGIGMRGSSRERFTILDEGMNLYSALPHREKAPKSWQGPSPNLKMLVRSGFPSDAPFALRVTASKGPFNTHPKVGLIDLRTDQPAPPHSKAIVINAKEHQKTQNVKWDEKGSFLRPINNNEDSLATYSITIAEAGLYQIDLLHPYLQEDQVPSFRFSIGKDKIEERLHLDPAKSKDETINTPITLAFINRGTYEIQLGGRFFVGHRQVTFTPISKDSKTYQGLISEADKNLNKFSNALPVMRVFAGTRTDDGMDYANFSEPKVIANESAQTYEFIGNFSNLPVPPPSDLTSGDLANTLILGLWNANLVNSKEDSGPPLLIQSIELEAPYYPSWPPKSHREIFFNLGHQTDEMEYASQIIERFCVKAFRRPIDPEEIKPYLSFWKESRSSFDRFEDSIKEVLVGILCSPKFLFLLQSGKDSNESIEDSALASRLSFFLWNSSPDRHLLNLSAEGKLKSSLKEETDRLLADPRSLNMIRAFAREWLRIDRLEDLNINVRKFPAFNRFIKEDMAEETYRFIHQVLIDDDDIKSLIASDYSVLNKNLAQFYGIEGITHTHMAKVQLPAGSHRGGLLTLGSILSGHSDGTHSHPIKRAVWLKEKILGEKAPPPPPNVPELDPDTPGFEELTLKEQLELHRNKASCVDCHLKIDPYGVVFENFDATGRFVTAHGEKPVDAKTTLPDGTEVEGLVGIQNYILEHRMDSFARSLIEHLYAYALGRQIGFADEKDIDHILAKVQESEYSFRSVIHHIISSPSFTQQQGGM